MNFWCCQNFEGSFGSANVHGRCAQGARLIIGQESSPQQRVVIQKQPSNKNIIAENARLVGTGTRHNKPIIKLQISCQQF
jgi:hypothetical protein